MTRGAPCRSLEPSHVLPACTLLRDTDLGVTEIAFATGWASLGTFGRIFRDITGRSPRDLRVTARGDTAALPLVPA